MAAGADEAATLPDIGSQLTSSGPARVGVAVVSGGGSGIGRATAAALAARGFSVLIAGRRSTVLEETRQGILVDLPDAKVETRATDVADPDACEALVADAVERLGGIDVLVTAAATYEPVHILDMTADAWDRCMDIALRGSVLCAVAAARRMKEAGGGRIILVSSISGAVSEPESAHYSAAKAAIISLAKSMAVDLAADHVTVNTVAPGWTHTPMVEEFVEAASHDDLKRINPMARLGRPEEIAHLITYLATDAPDFISGTTLFIDGGQTALAQLP
jgi:NAD(P)-dependent dehydrogenase (short-subunit alcohol dehydrogenase family)